MRPPRIHELFLCLATAVSVWAQTPSEKWKAAVAAADSQDLKDGVNRCLKSREALTIAETFEKSDVRWLESLARVADYCWDDAEIGAQDESKKALHQALSSRPAVVPKDARYADALLALASSASELNKYHDALLVYGEARILQEQFYGPTDQRVSMTCARMAEVYSWRTDHAQARRTMNYALELQDRARNSKREIYGDLLAISARLFAGQGEGEKAAAEIRRAADVYRKIWGPKDARLAKALRGLSWTANRDSRVGLQIEIANIWKAAKSERSAEYNTALCELGQLFTAQQKFPEAVRAYEDAIRIRESAGLHDENLVSAIEGLAQTRAQMDSHRESALFYEKALRLRQDLHQPPASFLNTWAWGVREYAYAGDLVAAESKFKALLNEGRLTRPFAVVHAAESLGESYAKRGDPGRAVEKFEIAAATHEAIAGGGETETIHRLTRLARAYREAGRYDDANRTNQRIATIQLEGIGKAVRDPNEFGTVMRKGALIVTGLAWSLMVFGALGYFFLSRRLDRRLAKMYEPSTMPELPPLAPEYAFTREEDTLTEFAPVAVMVAAPPRAQAVQSVEYHGDGGDLFAMRVVNLLFSLLTLGLYSFWGKAKVRRYLSGQAEFEGDRFAFDGRGRELILGWLKGAPWLGFIIFFPSVLPLFWQKAESVVVGELIPAAAFLLLWPIARVGAHRYRMNRMSWRGIRFSFVGRTLRYFAISVGGYVLSALTMGLYVPALFIQQRRLLFNGTRFGTEPFRFEGRTRDLLPTWLCALPVLVVTSGLFWPWWSAFRYRYVWANTTIAGARFRCTITGWSLARLWIGNAVLVVATLGLGWSWASIRTLRFWSRGIELVGDLDAAAVQQRQIASSAVGESFADFLGFDFGF